MGYPTVSCAAIRRSLHSPTQTESDLRSRLPAPRSAVGRSSKSSSTASCLTVNRCFISCCRSLLRLPDCRSLEHHSLRNALRTLGCCDHLQKHFSGLARWRSEICDILGCTKWLFPGDVKLDEYVAFCLPTAGRRAQFFTPYSQNLGRAF